MAPDLFGLPFDHFQRYASASQFIKALGDGVRTVLEIGANRQRLLGQLLPAHHLTYTDAQPQEDTRDFLVADASDLPFEPASYDVVVSLDMLEHVPPALRPVAVAEAARVAAHAVVLGCPIDRPWVHAAEQAADAAWVQYFKESYPWLAEHKVHGLVHPEQVSEAMKAAGLHVVQVPHGDARLWASLMTAHFSKEAVPEFAPLVAAADRYYNRELFAKDSTPETYREFFVGVRDVRHVPAIERLRDSLRAGNDGARELLKSLGEVLPPAVKRIQAAEDGWRSTAQLWEKGQADLSQLNSSLAEKASQLGDVERRAAEADAQLVALQALLREREAHLESTRNHLEGSRNQLEENRAHVAQLQERLQRGDATVDRLQAEIAALRQELAGRQDAVDAMRAELAQRDAQLQVGAARLAEQQAGLEGMREHLLTATRRTGDLELQVAQLRAAEEAGRLSNELLRQADARLATLDGALQETRQALLANATRQQQRLEAVEALSGNLQTQVHNLHVHLAHVHRVRRRIVMAFGAGVLLAAAAGVGAILLKLV